MSLKIPAGTQSGKVFRLRSKGVITVREPHKGDLFARAVVETPVNLTDEQLEQVAPTLEKSFTSTQAILQKYGVDPDSRNNGKKLGLKKARQLKQELEVVRFNTLAELDDVLTDQQLLEYQKIQAEHKEELKQRVFDRRQANQGSQRRGKAVRSIN